MLKKFFKKVDNLLKNNQFNKNPVTSTAAPINTALQLAQEHINSHALEIVTKLQKAGFEAYLVGGCIRDLLLGIPPKDFDVATSATPEQIKKLFRNSRIIGRRFKLVHVFWGKETIEVATFRGAHTSPNTAEHAQHASGRILRDNVFGTLSEDAYRRDFTINALYYNPNQKQLIDYVDGIEDINSKLIKLIGNPQKRYQEDPVRMLRAVRFAAKLNFTIEAETAAQIYEQAQLLADIPAARLFDEVLKLFLANNALKTFELLCQYNLFAKLFPDSAAILQQSPYTQLFLKQALLNTDQRLTAGKTVHPAFLYACLLWPVLLSKLAAPITESPPNIIELQHIANDVIAQQSKYTTIPKRFSIPMREIWECQVKLMRRQANKADILLNHPRFRAGYDFLLLRESVGEQTGLLAAWWANYQQTDELSRRKMIRELATSKKNYRQRRRSKPKFIRSNNTTNNE